MGWVGAEARSRQHACILKSLSLRRRAIYCKLFWTGMLSNYETPRRENRYHTVLYVQQAPSKGRRSLSPSSPALSLDPPDCAVSLTGAGRFGLICCIGTVAGPAVGVDSIL